MPTEVIMPKVDMDMSEGTIAAWHVNEGQTVEKGAPLFDIETDKANMEVEAPASGVLQGISANEGDVIAIGQCIAYIVEDGEEITEQENGATNHETKNADTATTDAATSDRNQPESVETLNPAPADGTTANTNVTDEPVSGTQIRATPLARNIARNNRLDLAGLKGNGPRGRITGSDVERALPDASLSPPASLGAESQAVASPARLDSLGIRYSTSPVSKMRSAIAKRLSDSKQSIPHFYLEAECRVDNLLEFRSNLNKDNARDNELRVSVNDLVVMACARALQAVPEANVCWAGNEIVQFEASHLSVAVSIDGGLMTPVVRQAESLPVAALSAELSDLAHRARNGKLSSADCQGGSMSVSNLGMLGVSRFSAIINPPESMIIAIGSARETFVPDNQSQPALANVMSVTLSCDHRVIDGATGARWLKAFQTFIEQPEQLSSF